MMILKQGEIYYADLSSAAASELGGFRPVVILQNDFANKFSPTIIVAPLTSRINRARLPTHIEIVLSQKSAVILLEQLRVLDKTMLRQKVGTLSNGENDQIKHALGILFSLQLYTKENTITTRNPYENVDKSQWNIVDLLHEQFDMLDELKTSVNTVIEKQKIAKGKLSEFAVVDYFRNFGYESQRAGSELDQQKIDVIAANTSHIIFTQVKAGQVSMKEVSKFVECVKDLHNSYVDPTLHRVACICAKEFPVGSELERHKMESVFGMPIIFLHKYEVLKVCPEYKSTVN